MTAKVKKLADEAFEYTQKKLFSQKTKMLFDYVVSGNEAHFPTAAEINAYFPNPGGNSTGMEDGMINGATVLDACLIRYELDNDSRAAEFAKQIIHGMIHCAQTAETEGFIPRGVALEDCKTHYPDSSLDQYTMFLFAVHRYWNSAICTAVERNVIADICVSIARRAEKNIVPETGYNILNDRGEKSLVGTFWGPGLGNHEYCRLPMLYLLAYEVTHDLHWFNLYQGIREEAFQKLLPMGRYYAMYALQQMQSALLICYEVDPDEGWKERYLGVMNTVADYAQDLVDVIWTKINACNDKPMLHNSFRERNLVPSFAFQNLGYSNAVLAVMTNLSEIDTYYALQDGLQIAIITKLVPGRARNPKVFQLLERTYQKIDWSCYDGNQPIYFLQGYYRGLM